MQNADWNAVRDFLAVARSGSLSRAAATLAVNASTVGRRIEALEERLGVRLFHRAQTGYVLTDDGQDLVDRAEAIEAAALALERRAAASGQIGGRVRLATAENLATALVIPALHGLRARHPELTVEVLTDIRSVNLHRREADLALRLVPPTRGQVRVRRVGVMRYGLYGSADYLGRRGESDGYIAWSEAYADLPAAQWIERRLAGAAPVVVVSSLKQQVAAAGAGLGLAVLPCFVAAMEPSLRHVASDADALQQDLWLAIHADLAGSARVRAVADCVEEAVAANVQALEGRRLTPPGRHR